MAFWAYIARGSGATEVAFAQVPGSFIWTEDARPPSTWRGWKASGMSNCFWLNVAWSSPMRQFVDGARSLAGPPPTARDAAGHDPGTNGRCTRCSSGSGECGTTRGAVDQDGVVPGILVQPRRDARAAKRQFRRPPKDLDYVPRVIVTGKLRSHRVAQRQLLPKVEHRQSRHLNNRAENSHRPTRRSGRRMQRSKSPEQARDFLSAHAFIHDHLYPRRHLLTAGSRRENVTETFNVWRPETCPH